MFLRPPHPVHLSVLLAMFLAACSPLAKAPRAAPSAASTHSAPAAASTPTALALSDLPLQQAALVVRQIAGSEAHWLMPIDPRTGAQLRAYDAIDLGANFYYQLTPDRRTLVIVSYPLREQDNASVRFLDLATWTESIGLLLPTRRWTSSLAISPDGSRLVFATVERRQSRLWLVDVTRRLLLKTAELPGVVAGMQFTSDGTAIMLYERQEDFETGVTEGGPVAELRSASDLQVSWSRVLDNVTDGFVPNQPGNAQPHEPGTGSTFRPAVTFDPQLRRMYVLHADVERLTQVDFGRQRTLTRDVRAQLSWLDHLLELGTFTAYAKAQDGIERHALLSADGTTLYTSGSQNKLTHNSNGSWDLQQTPLPLQAIRVADATVVFRSAASGDMLSLAADGESMLVARAQGEAASIGTSRVSLQDGSILGAVAGDMLQPSSRLDGTPLLVGMVYADTGRATSTLSAYDALMAPLGSWQTPRYSDWIRLP